MSLSRDLYEHKRKNKAKRGDDSQIYLSERGYLAAIGGFLVSGILLTVLVSVLTYNLTFSQLSTTSLLFLMIGVGLFIPIAGIVIAFRSDNWIVSSFGYVLVVVPLSFLIGPMIAIYNISSVMNVVISIATITGCMFWLAVISPPIVQRWQTIIIGILLSLIVLNLSYAWFPVEQNSKLILGFIDLPRVIDYGATIFFSGLIFYDVNKAMQQEHTLDNAVDATIGIYLDVLNAFLYLLRASGSKNVSSK